MAETDSPDLLIIRSVVDRVIDELGPAASPHEVRSTAASVLKKISPTRPSMVSDSPIIITDLPGRTAPADGLSSLLEDVRHTAPGSEVWLRASLDMTGRDTRSVAAAVERWLDETGTAIDRFCIALAPSTAPFDVGVLTDLLTRFETLHLSVVCARPGLGVYLDRVSRVLDMRGALPTGTASRLSLSCMRSPIDRAGGIRFEIAMPATDAGLDLTAFPESVRSLSEQFSARPFGGRADVATVLMASASVPSARWNSLSSWRPSPPDGAARFDGIRVEGWPARGVRPFRRAPLAVGDDDPLPYLHSLAAAGAVAPVFPGRQAADTDGIAGP